MKRLFLTFVLLTSVTTEDTCGSEFAQFVAYHVFSNVNGDEFVAVMHCDSKSDEIGGDHRGA